jgi:hypothetical protein
MLSILTSSALTSSRSSLTKLKDSFIIVVSTTSARSVEVTQSTTTTIVNRITR